MATEETEEPILLHWTNDPPIQLSEFPREAPTDAGMNPVRRWLVNVMKQCGSAEEVERVAKTVHCANTRAMLLRGAARWRAAEAASVIDP